jgi:hypothetical protein
MQPPSRPLVLLAAGLAVAASAPAAAGTGEPRPLDRWSLSAGGFDVASDTTISARAQSGEYGAEGSFNLEDDLGLDDRQPVAHARFEMLTTPSQAISLEWFAYSRENEASLARTIVLDGTTFEASARVRGRIDYDFASAAYRWWFGERSTVWGVGAGIAHYRVATRLEGEASLDGETVRASTSSSDAAFAPLLALGWRHAFSERWRVYADLSGVAKDGGALRGHIVDAAVGVEWFPARRVGVALEYGVTKIRLVRERELVDARLDLALRGPTLFLRLR